jgi:hypothetical protein
VVAVSHELSSKSDQLRVREPGNQQAGVNSMLKLFYLLACLFSLVNGAWMLLFPLSWYTSFPADISHTGPFNPHFVRDLGVAFAVIGLAFGWSALHLEHSRPVHLALTIFFIGHALIHVTDIVTGRLPNSHWLIDLPGVFLPMLIMLALSVPAVRKLVSST